MGGVETLGAPALHLLHGTLPPANLLVVFGMLLGFGVLGGLLAARWRWLPTITGLNCGTCSTSIGVTCTPWVAK